MPLEPPIFFAQHRRHSPIHERATDSGQTMGMRFVRREISTLAARGFLQEHLTLAHAYAMFLCYLRMQSVALNMRARCAELGVWTAARKAPPTRTREDLISRKRLRSNQATSED